MSKVLSFSVPDDWLEKLAIAFPDTSPNLAGKKAVGEFLRAIDRPSNVDSNIASNTSNLDESDRSFLDTLAATVAALDGTVAELYQTVNHQGQRAIELHGRVEAIESLRGELVGK